MDATAWHGLRVLMIEPEEKIAAPLAEGLRARGACVVRAVDGRSALAHLRGHAADAVLLAAPLPDADWMAFAAWVRQGPEAPTLIVLGNLEQLTAEQRSGSPNRGGPDALLERGAKLDEVCEALAAAWSSGPDPAAEEPAPESLPELLVGLHEQAHSGVLEIRADGVCTRIFVHRGAPVFAEGGALRETLGRLLLQRGALTEADYVRVIERMTERLMESETTRMGEVLVELGLLRPAEVFAALSDQVREKIIGCFRWQRFQHAFEATEALAPELSVYPRLSLETLIRAGLRAHFGPDRLEPLLAPLAKRRPALAADRAELTVRFGLSSVEQRVLPLIDGQRTLAEIRRSAALDDVHGAQVLAALILVKGIVWQDGSRHVVEGVGTSSRLVAASEPSRSSSATPAVPAAAGARPPHSLLRLRRSSGRAAGAGSLPIDPKGAGLEAEHAFRRGLQCLERSAFSGALRAFGRACALRGDEPEYRMYEAWAALLVAPDDEARALARAKAKAGAERMLQRDRESPRAHGILGQILLASGDVDAAGSHFRAVLRAVPQDRDALRGMRMIERRRPGA
ncbi:DUF4388 domain-containing protein [Myxococcota bacterium]|nr:DUF4388 domain-containing protein [Myxococcota bacterium]